MEDRLKTLTLLAYGAALDDRKWGLFLKACSDLAGGGVRTCLFGYDMHARIELGARQFGYDPAFEQSYVDYYSEKDFFAARLMEHTAGQLVAYEDIWSEMSLRGSEFYNEWVRPQEDITGGCSVLLFKQEKRLFAFSGSIRSRDSDRLETPWQRIVTQLTPHLQQAFEMARVLASAELEKRALVNVQNPAAAGCIVLTRNRRIVFANANAEAMLSSGTVIRSDFRQRLLFQDAGCEGRFAHALAGGALEKPQTIRILDRAGGPATVCRIAPIGSDDIGHRPSGILFGREEPRYLLTIARDQQVVDIAARVRDSFGLTPHETQVVLQLSSGLSAREIADIRGTSVYTVRNQIHSAMSKMNAHRQSEVVRVVEAMRNPLLP
ncbi:PAS and helix-turn-helix domain-containing protein [Nitratireductor sp. GISD-1A_MAKvit]|uniref:helix-turn-helix transcriptional regulator n=1 Tax=Nitratireductor sp. GISD-1A_MAKvit TaxID=3234198 RepID=UPI00346751CB